MVPECVDVGFFSLVGFLCILTMIRYIPFNGGPRLCVGQQFALTEMGYTITKILQTYDRIENRMDAPPKMKTDIVLQPAEGVQIAFFAAKN